jgi:hypothetical protein
MAELPKNDIFGLLGLFHSDGDDARRFELTFPYFLDGSHSAQMKAVAGGRGGAS